MAIAEAIKKNPINNAVNALVIAVITYLGYTDIGKPTVEPERVAELERQVAELKGAEKVLTKLYTHKDHE